MTTTPAEDQPTQEVAEARRAWAVALMLRAEGTPLFHATDSDWTEIGAMGLQSGRVCGSYAHLIDRAEHVLQTRTDTHGHVTQ